MLLHQMAPVPRTAPPTSARSDSFAEETASLRQVVRSVVAHVMGVRLGHPDVDDCAHEALSRALEGQSRLRPGEPVRPWVIGIARHVAIDALRAKKRTQKRTQMDRGDEPGGAAILDQVADVAPSPEERASTQERAVRIEAVLAKLPPEHKDALVLFHVEGLKYQAISAKLGVPMGTIATWIARGRKMIASELSLEDEVKA